MKISTVLLISIGILFILESICINTLMNNKYFNNYRIDMSSLLKHAYDIYFRDVSNRQIDPAGFKSLLLTNIMASNSKYTNILFNISYSHGMIYYGSSNIICVIGNDKIKYVGICGDRNTVFLNNKQYRLWRNVASPR